MKNDKFLDILSFLVETKYNQQPKYASVVRKFWFSRLPTETKGVNDWSSQTKKIVSMVLKFLCKEGQFVKANKLIDQLMTKRIFLNDPILPHLKTIVKMLEISNSDIKEMEMNKLMIESSDSISRHVSLFDKVRDIKYIENNMLFMNELKQYSDIKSFYLKMKIPVEQYSIRVAPLLIKWVGSSRIAENIFLQHPYSVHWLEKLMKRFKRRIEEQESDSESDINENVKELSSIELKYATRIAYWTIFHLTTSFGHAKLWEQLNELLQYKAVTENLENEHDLPNSLEFKDLKSVFYERQYGDKGLNEDKESLTAIKLVRSSVSKEELISLLQNCKNRINSKRSIKEILHL